MRAKQVAAVAACILIAAMTPVLPVAARSAPPRPAPSPSPSPTPSPAARCPIPAGLEDDPQERQLQKHCIDELQRIQDEKSKLSSSLALAVGSSQSLQEMLDQTRTAIRDNRDRLAKLQAQIDELTAREAATQRQIAQTRQRLADRRRAFETFLRRSYERQPNLLSSILDSHGVSDFLRRATQMVQIQAFGRDLVNAVRAEEARLAQQIAQLHADQDQAGRHKDQLTQAQEQLVNNQIRESLILRQLNQSINDAQHELVSADSQTADLVARIVEAEVQREDELIQAANDAAWQAAQAWMASNNADFTASVGHSTKYPMIWPAQKGVITQPFGPTDYAPEPPGFGAAHFHSGIDVANSAGTEIYAADDGVIAAAADSMLGSHEIGYGKHVIIAHHNGVMTLYGHLEGWVVKVGDRVQQGQLIGFMGSTGMSSGPHLHFEVRINNTPTDPAPYLPPHGPNSFRQ